MCLVLRRLPAVPEAGGPGREVRATGRAGLARLAPVSSLALPVAKLFLGLQPRGGDIWEHFWRGEEQPKRRSEEMGFACSALDARVKKAIKIGG